MFSIQVNNDGLNHYRGTIMFGPHKVFTDDEASNRADTAREQVELKFADYLAELLHQGHGMIER